MAVKEKIKKKSISITIREDIYNTFKDKVLQLDMSVSAAVSVLVKDFNKTGNLPTLSVKDSKKYNSKGVEYMSKEEQAEIENDKELMAGIARARKQKGGRLVE